MSSGIQVHSESTDAFNDIHTKHSNKYCVFKIDKKEGETDHSVIIDFKGEKSLKKACDVTWEDEKIWFDTMKASVLEKGEPRYIIYDFDFTSPKGTLCVKDCFIYWSPDNANIKKKMVYASSQEYVKTAFSGLAKRIQVNDPADLDFMDVLKIMYPSVHNEVIEAAKTEK